MLPRIQSDEMALVAMLRVPVLPVVVPLVQVAVLADSVGVQTLEGSLVSRDVIATDGTGRAGVRQQLANDGKVGRSAVSGDAVIAFIGDVFVLG